MTITVGIKVVRSPGGPPGPTGSNSGQDLGWILTQVLMPGEVLDSPPLERGATFTQAMFHSRSKFAVAQNLTVHHLRAGAVVDTTVVPVGANLADVLFALPSALVTAAQDIVQLVLPSPADAQCHDMTFSLGSMP
jgi:hypothetical protein